VKTIRFLGISFTPALWLTPFGRAYTKERFGTYSYVGYSEYLIFGFRIVYVQETKPWEKGKE